MFSLATIQSASAAQGEQPSMQQGVRVIETSQSDFRWNAPRDVSAPKPHAYPTDSATPGRNNGAAKAGTTTCPSTVIATTNCTLTYMGGAGQGVIEGNPKVYLVFWGSQWGSPTNLSGATTFASANDPKGVAPYLYNFLAGLGTSGDNWSNVMAQYCDNGGTVTISVGATTCPVGAMTTGRATPNGALAGVLIDNATPAPAAAADQEIANEALKAAAYFGTNATHNKSSQYVIVSPTKTNPGSYKTGGFCAWHDYAISPSSTSGSIAYTNLPYLPDAGASCGQNFVNSGTAGTLDGVSIVEGHEYAETLSDMNVNPSISGWYNNSVGENGDICAWVPKANLGGAANMTTTTGTFAIQGTWSNVQNACSTGQSGQPISSPVFGSSSASITLSGRDFTGTSGVVVGGNPATGLVVNSDKSLTLTLPIGSNVTTLVATNTTWGALTTPFYYGSQILFSNTSLPNARQNSSYSASVASTGGPAGVTYALATGSALPTWLSLNPSTGALTGTPPSTGNFTFDVNAVSAGITLATYRGSVNVLPPAPIFTAATPPSSAQVGNPYSYTFTATSSLPLTFSVASGALPVGLSLSTSGVLSGTPTANGTYAFSVSANNGSKTTTATLNITVTTPAPTITALSSTTWWRNSVTITGTNFTGATLVKFGPSAAASFSVVSNTSITAIVPTGASTGTISVTTPGGTATSSATFILTKPTPSISSFTPATGGPGTSITITGSNLLDTSGATVNGANAPFVVLSATSVIVGVPAGVAAGSGKIILSSSVLANATSATNFKTSTSLVLPTVSKYSVTSGSVGTPVTLTGQNFAGALSVTFNNVSAKFTVQSATTILTAVPANATTGVITVTSAGGVSTFATSFRVSGIALNSTISSSSPTYGASVGGTVTLVGTNLAGVSAITVNGTAVTQYTIASNTGISFIIPAGATSGPIVLTTPGGTVTSASNLTII